MKVKNISTYLSLNSLEDIRNKETPPPAAIDTKGRSSQQFCVEVVVQKDDEKRVSRAVGRDIYAVTAPLVVEAVERIMSGKYERPGVVSPGQLFNAEDFLNRLLPDDVIITLP